MTAVFHYFNCSLQTLELQQLSASIESALELYRKSPVASKESLSHAKLNGLGDVLNEFPSFLRAWSQHLANNGQTVLRWAFSLLFWTKLRKISVNT